MVSNAGPQQSPESGTPLSTAVIGHMWHVVVSTQTLAGVIAPTYSTVHSYTIDYAIKYEHDYTQHTLTRAALHYFSLPPPVVCAIA